MSERVTEEAVLKALEDLENDPNNQEANDTIKRYCEEPVSAEVAEHWEKNKDRLFESALKRAKENPEERRKREIENETKALKMLNHPNVSKRLRRFPN